MMIPGLFEYSEKKTLSEGFLEEEVMITPLLI